MGKLRFRGMYITSPVTQGAAEPPTCSLAVGLACQNEKCAGVVFLQISHRGLLLMGFRAPFVLMECTA